MRFKLLFASVFTIGILNLFVLIVLVPVMLFTGLIGGAILIVLTIIINIIIWLISPWIMDQIHRLFYKFEIITYEDLEKRSPYTAKFLKEACERNGMKLPMLRIVKDLNPTAYCYGSVRSNSRIVVSEGLFHYLTDEEVAAVYAHELGHIKHLDFVVMTVANTLLMILYEIYFIFTRMRSNSRNNPLPIIGLVSLIFWLIGTFIVLYLSRTREYMADRFSALETKNPNALSTALVKIAYGIAAQPDDAASRRLLSSTRSLGVSDCKSAATVGSIVSLSATETVRSTERVPAFDPQKVSRVFLFDVYNPWSRVVQLGSTHPLTGKRIKAMMDVASELKVPPMFNFDEISIYGQALDRGRLYRNFFFEVLIYFAPIVTLILGLVPALFDPSLLGLAPISCGLGLLLKGIYKFPPISEPKEQTILELMSDPYASPLRGQPVTVKGVVIGRAIAGSYFGEDMVIYDRSGGLMTLNYESIIPLIGNLIFGTSRTKKLINQTVRGIGWFRRKVSQVVDLKSIVTEEKTFASYNRLWAILAGILVAGVGVVTTVVAVVTMLTAGGTAQGAF
ncbi:MAG: M48 family metalloprotease [Deltaproteobacteria bacterium]|nr:M48 family metalloprotease [Candidatus Zymogenaceae bacterium]